MLNPLGMLTIDATSENWGGKEKKHTHNELKP